jgi:hypothetical protein
MRCLSGHFNILDHSAVCVHRIALSRDTGAELNAIHKRLDQFGRSPAEMAPERAWTRARDTDVYGNGSEITSRHNLVRREKAISSDGWGFDLIMPPEAWRDAQQINRAANE